MAINKWLLTSKTEERSTPQYVFNWLNNQFNFTLDPCSTHENAKCKKHYTKKEDWLKQDRSQDTVFINPPYWTEIKKRIEKAYITQFESDHEIVMLLPARTDTSRFHNYIYDETKGKARENTKIYFIKWRLKFWWSENSAPFPSMLVIFNDTKNKFKP